MCPITLSIIAASTIAFAQAAAAGAGIAAAASAAAAAASAVTAGATTAAAIGVGAGVAAGATTATGITTAVTVGATIGAVTPGATAITAAGLLTEAVAFASIGQGVHQNKEAKRRAKDARKDASQTAAAQRNTASDQAARATKIEAEAGASEKIRGERNKGIIHNLQNRGDVQIAVLTREIEREQQGHEAAAATRLEAVQGDVRSAFRNIQANENRARREARAPSNLSFALSLGSTALGSALKTA